MVFFNVNYQIFNIWLTVPRSLFAEAKFHELLRLCHCQSIIQIQGTDWTTGSQSSMLLKMLLQQFYLLPASSSAVQRQAVPGYLAPGPETTSLACFV